MSRSYNRASKWHTIRSFPSTFVQNLIVKMVFSCRSTFVWFVFSSHCLTCEKCFKPFDSVNEPVEWATENAASAYSFALFWWDTKHTKLNSKWMHFINFNMARSRNNHCDNCAVTSLNGVLPMSIRWFSRQQYIIGMKMKCCQFIFVSFETRQIERVYLIGHQFSFSEFR